MGQPSYFTVPGFETENTNLIGEAEGNGTPRNSSAYEVSSVEESQTESEPQRFRLLTDIYIMTLKK